MSIQSHSEVNATTRSGLPATTGGLAIFLLVMTAATWIAAAIELAGRQPTWTTSVTVALALVAIFAPSAIRPGTGRWHRVVNRHRTMVECLVFVGASAVALTLVMTLGEAGAFWAIAIGLVQFVYAAVVTMRNVKSGSAS